MQKRVVTIGILGVGNVGTGVARVFLEQAALLTERTGIEFRVKSALDLDWERERGIDLSVIQCTTDVDSILSDPEIDIVVETIGGEDPAFDYIMRALDNGKHVVTANKALVASRGRDLFRKARESNVDLLFEASVGGGIPIVKGLREGLVANWIRNLYGIVNGTSNYILTKMHQDGLEFGEALKEAQDKGFAEADPTLDVSGEDAAHKLAILASIASSAVVDLDDIYTEGISNVSKLDVDFAKSFGYTIKLLAICKMGASEMDLRVHPTLVPNSHLLASVSYELNAVFVEGDFVGKTMFYGPGAGERPTASAIASDIVDLAKDMEMRSGERLSTLTIDPEARPTVLPVSQVENRFYLRLYTYDAPGILARISGILGNHSISISSVVQLEKHVYENYVPLVILTHRAREADMQKALAEITSLDVTLPDHLRLRLF
jgi:homoserine dehydrogenase